MVGDLAMGRFRVLERIGSGGMGVVYRAFDERLQRYVALKEIEGAAASRILREAHAAARLNHPGIVTLYELGAQGDRALLVSELVAGETLGDLCRQARLSDRDVADVGIDVAAALAHAHQRGVVHRDVKPANVIVRDDEDGGLRAKLMDFGIAAVAGAPALTATGEVVGTLAYMAPEQAEGRAAGPAADAYSLALTLYECWAGSNPVARTTPVETARAIGAHLAPLREPRPDLPPALRDCVDACLDPDPELRPTLTDLSAALERAAPALDPDRAVPAPVRMQPIGERAIGRAANVGAIATVVVAIAILAGPAARPGLALALALVAVPGLLAVALPRALAPAAAVPLAALGVAATFPALAATVGDGWRQRAAIGVAGWWTLLVVGAALGTAPGLDVLGRPPAGWQRSFDVAADGLLLPLLEPAVLVGAAAFALGAAALGWVLRAGHVAITALAALLWAAGLEAGMRIVDRGGLSGRPALLAGAALIVVAIEFRRRSAAALPARLPSLGRAPLPVGSARH
jgi:hypothetical protein